MKIKLSQLFIACILLTPAVSFASDLEPGHRADYVEVFVTNHYNDYGPKNLNCKVKDTKGKYVLPVNGAKVNYGRNNKIVLQQKLTSDAKPSHNVSGTVVCIEDSPQKKEIFRFSYKVNRTKGKFTILEENLIPGVSDNYLTLSEVITTENALLNSPSHTVGFYVDVKK